jgi:hypothetical protein
MTIWSGTTASVWPVSNPAPRAGTTRPNTIVISAFPRGHARRRETVIRLRDEGHINDEVLRRIERELDLSESSTIM